LRELKRKQGKKPFLEVNSMARYSGHSTMGWMMGADGNPIQVVTAAPTTSLQRLAPQPQQMVLPATPDWRTNQVAPGMWGPRAGLELLPMQATIPQFDALNTGPITFTARPQRPFRPERLIAKVGRSGTSAQGQLIMCDGIYVGTKLQQLQLGAFDIEVYSETAFGVRMALDCADPGIEIQVPIHLLGKPPTDTDVIYVSIQWLGSSLM
jgi:hypothetical protein